MKIVIGLLKLILKIVAAPVVVVLTVAIWMWYIRQNHTMLRGVHYV